LKRKNSQKYWSRKKKEAPSDCCVCCQKRRVKTQRKKGEGGETKLKSRPKILRKKSHGSGEEGGQGKKREEVFSGKGKKRAYKKKPLSSKGGVKRNKRGRGGGTLALFKRKNTGTPVGGRRR